MKNENEKRKMKNGKGATVFNPVFLVNPSNPVQTSFPTKPKSPPHRQNAILHLPLAHVHSSRKRADIIFILTAPILPVILQHIYSIFL